MKKTISQKLTQAFAISLFSLIFFSNTVFAQFTHPGLSHKKSDLDRMKYQVAAQIEPYYSSYVSMSALGTASYDYTVRGNTSLTSVYRDSPGTNKSAFESDSRAAYYNALRWYITGDSRHAAKAVQCLNAWSGLTLVQPGGTESLSSNMIIMLLEAAEIIKSTYTGWATADINRFKAMLVFPGYSQTTIPSNLSTQGTWYWRSYKFDSNRAGNQGICAVRTCMAIGVFLDNQVIYDRAYRYFTAQTHRSDDLPYASGPSTTGTEINRTAYKINYNNILGTSIADYGFDDVLTNYIYSNGQCQESARDQGHTFFGLGVASSIAEIAWNQGDNIYGLASSRLLLGLEYTMRYNASYIQSYSDQTTPWEPTVANGQFLEVTDRCARSRSLAICPVTEGSTSVTRGNFINNYAWESPYAHYIDRGFFTRSAGAKWLARARDLTVAAHGGIELASTGGDFVGYGSLSFRRPAQCYGDPISGFSGSLPVYAMNVLPKTIEAENYDYSPVSGEDRTYNDITTGNSGNQYRTGDNVDIQTCSEGGYNVAWMGAGDWMTYTVYVPTTGNYNISIRYSATNSTGKIRFYFNGTDETGEITVPSTGGSQTWANFTVKTNATLNKGVQSLRIVCSGTSNSFNLNKFTISNGTAARESAEESVSSEPSEDVNLFPNPVTNILTISNNEGADLEVVDNMGNKKYAKKSISNVESVDMSQMNTGVYIIRMEKDGVIKNRKVIKQ